MQNKILIVEDEPDINSLLAKILKGYGHHPIQAYSGTEAGLLLKKEEPDLILLDLMLPGLPGGQLLAQIRENGSCVPVIILSAKNTLGDKVSMLTNGADDYITKPFEPEEVAARVQAALRRSGKSVPADMQPAQEVLYYQGLELYPAQRKVVLAGRELALTAHEFDILHLLMRTPQKVYSRERLYELVWHGGYYGENNTVNVHVSNIRKKIKEAGVTEEYIKTVYGIGFQLK